MSQKSCQISRHPTTCSRQTKWSDSFYSMQSVFYGKYSLYTVGQTFWSKITLILANTFKLAKYIAPDLFWIFSKNIYPCPISSVNYLSLKRWTLGLRLGVEDSPGIAPSSRLRRGWGSTPPRKPWAEFAAQYSCFRPQAGNSAQKKSQRHRLEKHPSRHCHLHLVAATVKQWFMFNSTGGKHEEPWHLKSAVLGREKNLSLCLILRDDALFVYDSVLYFVLIRNLIHHNVLEHFPSIKLKLKPDQAPYIPSVPDICFQKPMLKKQQQSLWLKGALKVKFPAWAGMTKTTLEAVNGDAPTRSHIFELNQNKKQNPSYFDWGKNDLGGVFKRETSSGERTEGWTEKLNLDGNVGYSGNQCKNLMTMTQRTVCMYGRMNVWLCRHISASNSTPYFLSPPSSLCVALHGPHGCQTDAGVAAGGLHKQAPVAPAPKG